MCLDFQNSLKRKWRVIQILKENILQEMVAIMETACCAVLRKFCFRLKEYHQHEGSCLDDIKKNFPKFVS